MTHEPVLLEETIENLVGNRQGSYIDCTAGGGGHLKRLLSELTGDCRVLALDKDLSVLKRLKDTLPDPRIAFVHADFRDLGMVAAPAGFSKVDGILLDLGVSSFQLDEVERGFSFHGNARLDMRMNQEQKLDAQEIVNLWPEEEIRKILWRYGEEKFAPAISRAISKARAKETIKDTGQLVEVIKNAIPARYRREKHPARKAFQALRIAVNCELDALEKVLPQATAALNKDGRLCVITFHSLEDRIVKQFFLDRSRICICPPRQPVCNCQHRAELKVVTKRPVVPGEDECLRNPRARSAKLRVAQRI